MGRVHCETNRAALLLLLLAMVMSACGTAGPTASTGAGASSAPGSASAAPTNSGGGAGAAMEAKLGVVFSMTGGAAAYGESQKKGVQLALDEINAGSGLKLTAVYEDDASTPQGGVNAFKKLVNSDKVALIIGPTLSNTALAADKVAQQAKVPVIGVSNTAGGITDIGNFIFRDSLTEAVVIPNTIKVTKEKLGIKKVAVLYGNDDAFTKAGYEAFKAALSSNGIQAVSEQTFAKGDRDFSAQLTQIKGQKPDALIVSALVEEATGIVKQARQLGITAPIIGGNGFNSPALIKNAGDAAEGVIVGAAWNSASSAPASKQFVDAFTRKYNSAPDQFAAQAYTGVKIAAEAIRSAGSTDGEKIRQALTQIKDLDTPLGRFSFTEKRDAQHTPVVQQVKGGKFTVLQ